MHPWVYCMEGLFEWPYGVYRDYRQSECGGRGGFRVQPGSVAFWSALFCTGPVRYKVFERSTPRFLDPAGKCFPSA